MTNREKLLKTNIYDLLCEMNEKMLDAKCIVRVYKKDYECGGFNCGECIARWLNEEVK